jgi:hypothetical protein
VVEMCERVEQLADNIQRQEGEAEA